MKPKLDLGSGHELSAMMSGDEILGYIDRHTNPTTGAKCEGYIPVQGGPKSSMWTVEIEEPLTLSPSLHCPICGDHGFVKKGRWEPA